MNVANLGNLLVDPVATIVWPTGGWLLKSELYLTYRNSILYDPRNVHWFPSMQFQTNQTTEQKSNTLLHMNCSSPVCFRNLIKATQHHFLSYMYTNPTVFHLHYSPSTLKQKYIEEGVSWSIRNFYDNIYPSIHVYHGLFAKLTTHPKKVHNEFTNEKL